MARPKVFRATPPVSVEDIDDAGRVKEATIASTATAGITPELSAGDVDARWDEAESSGEEAAGGSNPTPDQEVVDEIGKAIGLTYEEGEPLRTGRKEEERDEHRWELDPASAEDYGDRARESSESEAILKMRHRDRYERAER